MGPKAMGSRGPGTLDSTTFSGGCTRSAMWERLQARTTDP